MERDWLQSDRCLDEWSYGAADGDAVDAAFAVNAHVQNAAPAHPRALLTVKSGSGFGGDEAMPHHVRSQGAGGTSGGGIFRDAIIGREHSGISSVGCGGEGKDAHWAGMVRFKARPGGSVERDAVDGFGIGDCDEKSWISGVQYLWCNI